MEAVYGLILAAAVMVVSGDCGASDAERVAVVVLVTAVVFRLAHVYAGAPWDGVSQERRLIRADVAQALRDRWALVDVVIPLVLVLARSARSHRLAPPTRHIATDGEDNGVPVGAGPP